MPVHQDKPDFARHKSASDATNIAIEPNPQLAHSTRCLIAFLILMLLLRFNSLALLAALLLAGCSQYATVSEKRRNFVRRARRSARSLRSSRAIVRAMRQAEARAARGDGRSARRSARWPRSNSCAIPADTGTRDAYNFAVARIFGTIQQAKLDPWTQPLRVPAAGGDFVLTRKPDPRPQWNPALYDFTPADQFDVKGTYVTERRAQGRPRRAAGGCRPRENENARGTSRCPRFTTASPR